MRKTGLIIMGLLFAAGVARANFSGSDNFNDNSVDSTKWGSDFGSGTGALAEINQHIEFTTSGAPTSFDQAVRPWILNFGSFTSDWSLQLDVAIPVPSPALDPGHEISLGIAVLNSADNSDVMTMFFQQDPNSPSSIFFSGLDAGSNSTTFEQRTATPIGSGSVMLSWSAASRTLTASYNAGSGWTNLTSQDITSGLYDWGMSASSTFQAAIVGFAKNQQVDSGVATADNFIAVPEPDAVVCFSIGATVVGGWSLSRRRFKKKVRACDLPEPLPNHT